LATNQGDGDPEGSVQIRILADVHAQIVARGPLGDHRVGDPLEDHVGVHVEELLVVFDGEEGEPCPTRAAACTSRGSGMNT